MEILKRGSSGLQVIKVQEALQAAGLLKGGVDGLFESDTEAAVKRFQTKSGLAADGVVGPGTWAKLFPVKITGDLSTRSLALTGTFETSQLAPTCFAAVTGNFDGQGISYGALQWNFGQGTLQPLLKEMMAAHPDIMADIFGPELDALRRAVNGSKQEALDFANTIQNTSRHVLLPEWKIRFNRLGLTPEFQTIEVKGASAYYNKGKELAKSYTLWSARGQALMFDICVQNGSISQAVREQILADFNRLSPSLSREETEVQKMVIIANRRAEAANPRFVEDVRKRKLCIATGKGVVHGASYDLEAQFGIDLSPVG